MDETEEVVTLPEDEVDKENEDFGLTLGTAAKIEECESCSA